VVDRVCWTVTMVATLQEVLNRKKITHTDVVRAATNAKGDVAAGYSASNYIKYFSVYSYVTQCPECIQELRIVNIMDEDDLSKDRDAYMTAIPMNVKNSMVRTHSLQTSYGSGTHVQWNAKGAFTLSGNYPGVWTKIKRTEDFIIVVRHQHLMYILTGKPVSNKETKLFIATLGNSSTGHSIQSLWHRANNALKELLAPEVKKSDNGLSDSGLLLLPPSPEGAKPPPEGAKPLPEVAKSSSKHPELPHCSWATCNTAAKDLITDVLVCTSCSKLGACHLCTIEHAAVTRQLYLGESTVTSQANFRVCASCCNCASCQPPTQAIYLLYINIYIYIYI
jgi:hypothetical protein